MSWVISCQLSYTQGPVVEYLPTGINIGFVLGSTTSPIGVNRSRVQCAYIVSGIVAILSPEDMG